MEKEVIALANRIMKVTGPLELRELMAWISMSDESPVVDMTREQLFWMLKRLVKQGDILCEPQ